MSSSYKIRHNTTEVKKKIDNSLNDLFAISLLWKYNSATVCPVLAPTERK